MQTQFYLACVSKELILDQPSTFDIKMSECHTGLTNRKSLWKKGWFRLSQFKLLPSDLITVLVSTQVDSAVTHFTKTNKIHVITPLSKDVSPLDLVFKIISSFFTNSWVDKQKSSLGTCFPPHFQKCH